MPVVSSWRCIIIGSSYGHRYQKQKIQGPQERRVGPTLRPTARPTTVVGAAAITVLQPTYVRQSYSTLQRPGIPSAGYLALPRGPAAPITGPHTALCHLPNPSCPSTTPTEDIVAAGSRTTVTKGSTKPTAALRQRLGCTPHFRLPRLFYLPLCLAGTLESQLQLQLPLSNQPLPILSPTINQPAPPAEAEAPPPRSNTYALHASTGHSHLTQNQLVCDTWNLPSLPSLLYTRPPFYPFPRRCCCCHGRRNTKSPVLAPF